MSRGVPLSVYGDEFGRTQNGNNNPYNIDSVATWNNYRMINTDSPQTVISGQHNNLGTDSKADSLNSLFVFAKTMVQLRRDHVALRQTDYNMPIYIRKEDGSSSLSDSDKCVWVQLDGSAVGDSGFLVFINSHSADVDFKIPAAAAGKKWVRIADTAYWAESSSSNVWTTAAGWYPTPTTSDSIYGVKARSVVIFQESAQ